MTATDTTTANTTATETTDAKAQLAAAKAALAEAKAKLAAERAAAKAEKAKAAENKVTSRDAKRALATKLVAAASAIEGLTDADKATIAQWLHHLPIAHETFTEFLPAPDRSNWR